MIDINNNIVKRHNCLTMHNVYDHTKTYIITPFRDPRVFITVHLIKNNIRIK